MLKTLLTITALTLAQLSAAHAQQQPPPMPKLPVQYPDDGLRAHHGTACNNCVTKPPKQQVTLPAHIPPKIHGPNPGPYPGVFARRTQ